MRLSLFRGTRRWLAVAGILVIAAGLLAIGGQALVRTSRLTVRVPAPPGSLRSVPPLSHAYVVLFENKDISEVIGDPHAPTFNALRERYASLDVYQGIAHPSQPNYLALVSGSTQDVADDDPHDVDAPTIFDQLEATGRDWRVYAEGMPSGCFAGLEAPGSGIGTGTYVRKHNPAISFDAIREDPARCARIQPLGAFDAAAADLEIIIPDQCHDGHDCPVADADAWLDRFMDSLLATPAYQEGGAAFILFDEADSKNASNRVPAIVVSGGIQPGTRSIVPHDHYSILHTLQEAWGLPCLAESCAANTVGEVFGD